MQLTMPSKSMHVTRPFVRETPYQVVIGWASVHLFVQFPPFVESYKATKARESLHRQSVQVHCAAIEKVPKNKKILRGSHWHHDLIFASCIGRFDVWV
jgi:hypothetical protein